MSRTWLEWIWPAVRTCRDTTSIDWSAAVGEPPGAFRRRLLLERAAHRLMSTADAVIDVGFDAGTEVHQLCRERRWAQAAQPPTRTKPSHQHIRGTALARDPRDRDSDIDARLDHQVSAEHTRQPTRRLEPLDDGRMRVPSIRASSSTNASSSTAIATMSMPAILDPRSSRSREETGGRYKDFVKTSAGTARYRNH